MDDKEKKLKEIEELLKVYDGEMEIDAYVLKYLSFEELESIELNILKNSQMSSKRTLSGWLSLKKI